MTSENVALLFTDIVASTERSQQLSPEVADEDRRGHFSILRQAIAQSGGKGSRTSVTASWWHLAPRRLPLPARWPCSRGWPSKPIVVTSNAWPVSATGLTGRHFGHCLSLAATYAESAHRWSR